MELTRIQLIKRNGQYELHKFYDKSERPLYNHCFSDTGRQISEAYNLALEEGKRLAEEAKIELEILV